MNSRGRNLPWCQLDMIIAGYHVDFDLALARIEKDALIDLQLVKCYTSVVAHLLRLYTLTLCDPAP